MKADCSRLWAPGPSEDITVPCVLRFTRDDRNSRDQSYIFSFYLPFVGFLWWVRLYLCSQESIANDVSAGCLSYFCILGEFGHRVPLLGEYGHRVLFLLLCFEWVLAQDTFFASVCWVSMSTGYLPYFCMLDEHRVPILLERREMYHSLGRDLDTVISRELRLFPYVKVTKM